MPVKHPCSLKSRMFIHWWSLVVFGIIFWFLLCAFDLLGGSQHGYVYDSKDYDLLYETFYMEKIKKDETSMQFIQKLQNFGFSLLVWNSVTFLCSVLFCYVVRMFWWVFAKSFYSNRKTQIVSTSPFFSNSAPVLCQSNSKIPIKVKPYAISFKGSSSQTKLSNLNVNRELASTPNVIGARTVTDFSEDSITRPSKCFSFIKSGKILSLPMKEEYRNIDNYVDTNELNKLREEIIMIQNNSLNEQSEMSRKINVLNREKKDLIKQLTTAQRENKAAKQQIEELAQDKMIFIKKLETVNKEIKNNTKSKKLNLAKMEELSNNADNLKLQLEQMTRDKDILENKLKLLKEEHERLQERIIINDDHICPEFQENMPERDTDTVITGNTLIEKAKSIYVIKNLDESQTISGNNFDREKIQVKIQQLERNLKNFNSNKNTLNFHTTDEQTDSELSLCLDESDIKTKVNDDNDVYDFGFSSSTSFNSSPRLQYRSNKINPYLPSLSNQTSRVHLTDSKPDLLEAVEEKVVSNESNQTLTELIKGKVFEIEKDEKDEYSSSQESLDNIPSVKMVSSSTAFQNFLKKSNKNLQDKILNFTD